MRTLALSFTLAALAALAACASTEQKSSNQATMNTATTKATTPTTNSPTSTANSELPIAPAHGGGSTTSAPAASNTASAPEETGMDTSALDAKIAKAEEKATAQNATEADKLAAAAAYLERADIFMNAGKPTLYKYALRDYRRTLRYQPDNKQAQDSANMIVSIYKSMGRPVPEL